MNTHARVFMRFCGGPDKEHDFFTREKWAKAQTDEEYWVWAERMHTETSLEDQLAAILNE